MAKKSRIRPTPVEQTSDKIKPTEIDDSVPVSFNFKNLAQNSGKFKYSEQPKNYFLKLLERLATVSGMNRDEMIIHNKSALRCHQINFSDSRVSESGFGLSEDVDDDAWQFQISSNKHGRVHGYFVANVFFVVWLDPGHELYPGAK